MRKEERFTGIWRKSEMASCLQCGIPVPTFANDGICFSCFCKNSDNPRSETMNGKKSKRPKSLKKRINFEINRFCSLNKNQVNPNRYFSGYEDALRWVLREMQKN